MNDDKHTARRKIEPREGANRDPLTRAPDAHPVGTVIGGATGTAAGSLARRSVEELIDPTQEAAYWRDNFDDRPYVEQGATYEDYGPAYGLGVDAFTRYPGRTFDDIQPELSRRWLTGSGASTLPWDRAKPAVRDAWHRVNDRS